MMGPFKRPSQQYPLEHFKEWRTFAPYLEGTPLVKKYLEHYLRIWVETVPNPMEVEFLQVLHSEPLYRVEHMLQKADVIIGSTGIECMLDELKGITRPEKIMGKWESLRGELWVLWQLAASCSSPITCVREHGDWLVGGRMVSVKAKTGLSFQWECLHHILSSGYYVKGENTIAKYSHVGVSGLGNGAEDSVWEKVYAFAKADFPIILDEAARNSSPAGFIDYVPTAIPSASCVIWVDDERLEISVTNIQDDGDAEAVHFALSGWDDSSAFIGRSCPEDTYFSLKRDVGWLRRAVTVYMQKFQKSNKKLQGIPFLGWIVVPVHLSRQENNQPIDRTEITEALHEVIGDPDFAVRVEFPPEYKSGSMETLAFDFGIPCYFS